TFFCISDTLVPTTYLVDTTLSNSSDSDQTVQAVRLHSDGLCLFTKRLERGRFVWPVTRDGKVHLTPAQLSMLLEGINWKHPKRTERAGIRI
ncbi:IS66 family insertion sequence element accessory protein TnpB, partial [Escherichia coli]